MYMNVIELFSHPCSHETPKIILQINRYRTMRLSTQIFLIYKLVNIDNQNIKYSTQYVHNMYI